MPAERKAPEPPDEPEQDQEVDQAQEEAARRVGGMRIEPGGRVTYTQEGAVSATPGGPPDPTIDPDAGQPVGNVEAVDREDVAGLTGEGQGDGGGAPQGEPKKG
jgi:hypothetical protein